ncbi:MAG: multiheme c-type cytochrome, partial [Anaerolineales bacterium]
MRKNWAIIILAAGLLAACGGQPAATPTETIPTPGRPTSTPPPTATPIITPVVTAAADEGHQGLPLASEREELFSTSGLCTICHFDMTDETGKDVSIDTYWRATMMANAARDPYWQAVVRAEVLANPEAQEVIEDTCATCHMPMARFIASTEDELGLVFEGGFSEADHPLHAFGMDGVSCTLCHQVEEEGLGFPGSYSGGFVI